MRSVTPFVTIAPHGGEIFRFGRIVFNLHAQTADVDVDDLFLADIRLAPYVVEDIGTVERYAGVREEVFHDLELDLRQLDHLAVLHQRAVPQVEGEDWTFKYAICEVYDDYALVYDYENGQYMRAKYSKEEDNVTLGDFEVTYILDVTESELAALKVVQAMNGDTFEKIDETFSKIEELENKIENLQFALQGAERDKKMYVQMLQMFEDELKTRMSGVEYTQFATKVAKTSFLAEVMASPNEEFRQTVFENWDEITREDV